MAAKWAKDTVYWSSGERQAARLLHGRRCGGGLRQQGAAVYLACLQLGACNGLSPSLPLPTQWCQVSVSGRGGVRKRVHQQLQGPHAGACGCERPGLPGVGLDWGGCRWRECQQDTLTIRKGLHLACTPPPHLPTIHPSQLAHPPHSAPGPQEFFRRDMGLVLEMKPNYDDFSCQFRWVLGGGYGVWRC